VTHDDIDCDDGPLDFAVALAIVVAAAVDA
jgi:hypothetical protein